VFGIAGFIVMQCDTCAVDKNLNVFKHHNVRYAYSSSTCMAFI